MVNVGWMPLLPHPRRKVLGETNLAVHTPQQEWAKVRRQGTSLEIDSNGIPGNGRKTQLFWRTYDTGKPPLVSMESMRTNFYSIKDLQGVCAFL